MAISIQTHRLARRTIAPRLVAQFLAVIVFTGCTQATSGVDSAPNFSEAPPSQSQSEDSQLENAPVACKLSTQSAIENTVNSQTQAFGNNNYELAYSFASPSFRSSVSLDSFVALIAGSYGPLIESSKLRFSACLENASTGFALIEVRFLQDGDFVYALSYLMTDTSDGWRVEGASNLAVVGEGT